MKSQDLKETRIGLIYFSDPLCGWCFGFAPVLERFIRENSSRIASVEVVNYGLCPGPRALVVDEMMAEYIELEIGGIEKKTGVAFGRPFLDSITTVGNSFDSEPPSRAVAAVRQLAPTQTLAYLHAVQKSIDLEGANPSDTDNLAALARAAGIEISAFMKLFDSPQLLQDTAKEFEKKAQWGVSQAPTLFAEVGESRGKIANGFIDYNKLTENFEAFLSDLF